MGRHLKPIDDRKPAGQLAAKLRELKGDLTYGKLAKAIHVKTNTLSTMADGTYRGWQCVEQFLAALEACGVTITDEDRSECHALHKIAQQLYRESGRPAAPPSGGTSTQLPNAERVVPAPRGDPDDATAVVTSTEPVLACPRSLEHARTVHDIVSALVDLTIDRRMDLRSWRNASAFYAQGRAGSPEWEVLTARREPTLEIMRSIVRKCGGQAADLARWEQQWNRVMPSDGRSVDYAMSRDTDPAGEGNLQHTDDHVGKGAGQPTTAQARSRWRWLALPAKLTRHLTRRSPGEPLPPPPS